MRLQMYGIFRVYKNKTPNIWCYVMLNSVILLIMNDLDIKEIRKKLGLTQAELAKRLGVDPKTVQNWEYGKKIPESKHGILRSLLVAPQQYYGGDTEKQKADEPRMFIVPLMPISAKGGTLDEFSQSIMEDDCEKVLSPIKGADFAITVCGDSMSPDYPSGCHILIKKIEERAFIDWGKVFVLDTVNGTIIKKLMPVSDDPSKIMCISINPEYPPYEISLEYVRGIYRVLMCMSLK